MDRERYNGPVTIYHLIDGAKQASGLTVIIDVFRAFSLEACLLDMGAAAVRPVGSIEDALRLHEENPGSVLVGERKGIKIEGFDFGNSPSTVYKEAVEGKLILHTTSAGTQGVVNAAGASEILGGSLLTAKAIARYICKARPASVSLVAMGLAGNCTTEEDELCAEYIRALLLGEELPDLDARIERLRETDGKKFFEPELQQVFPEQDFWMCVDRDRFDFVVRIDRDETGFISRKIPV